MRRCVVELANMAASSTKSAGPPSSPLPSCVSGVTDGRGGRAAEVVVVVAGSDVVVGADGGARAVQVVVQGRGSSCCW